MNRYWKSGILCAVLLGSNTNAADSNSSLLDYVSPSADTVVYVNTRQAEKAMTPDLWKLIQKDRKKSLEEDKEDALFNTLGRDLEGVVNLYINSISPFRCSLVGVADITGDLGKDIEKLLKVNKENGGPAIQQSKFGKLPAFEYPLEISGAPPINLSLIREGDNRIHFRAELNSEGKSKLGLTPVPAKPSPVISLMKQQDLSFAVLVKTRRFTEFSYPEEPGTLQLKSFLQMLHAVSLVGRVQGDYLLLNAVLKFREEALASHYAQQIRIILSGIQQQKASPFSMLTNIQVSASKDELNISGMLDLRASWKKMSGFVSASKGINRGNPAMPPGPYRTLNPKE